ncbi:MAG TPA: tetratricopeptide repeat protein [Acidobacteriaceae bacterium]|jgi:Tfp pilus assembly protein PilF|nr:tetratricopeptide repeat protein [Acidobacteriaceae bacterium]
MACKIFAIVAGSLLVVGLRGQAQAVNQRAPDTQAEYAAHMARAQDDLRARRPDLAIPELEAAVKLEPANIDTQANLGVLLFFQGKPADAIPHLRAAVEADPSLAKIQGILGLAQLHVQDTDQGRKNLEAALPEITDQRFEVQVGLELVGSYTKTGELDQAARVLTQLRKTAPDNPEVLYAAYRTYYDLSGEARLALSLAAPDSPQMHQLLAHEEIKEGNTNKAIAQFRQAIAMDPRLPGVHYELGELLNTSGDPAIRKEAESEFQRALQEEPQNEQALCSLAAIVAQRGDIQQAYADYSRAVGLQPADATARLGLAKALIDMNQPAKALPQLEKAVQLEPTDALAHYRLALLYRRTGHPEKVQEQLDLFKQYKRMKDKLRALYTDLLIQPKEVQEDSQDKQDSK